MNSISVLEWNIHQQGGSGGGNIPSWVKDEINGYDIVVFTEFCTRCDRRATFISEIEQLGYHCVASDNTDGNDIFIAVKSCFSVMDYAWVSCYGVNAIPENLRVDIDCDGQPLTVMGIRIKTNNNFKVRRQQFQWALEQVGKMKQPVLITGDFNNGRRRSNNKDWNISIMRDMLEAKEFTLYTPEGSSIYGVENYNGYEFPDDHFATKKAMITLYHYDREFTSHDPLTYFLGQDFQEPWYPGANEKDLAKVAPPFPDHAILKGTLHFLCKESDFSGPSV